MDVLIPDAHYYGKLQESQFKLLCLDECEIVQPTYPWELPKRDGRLKNLVASELKKDEHFTFVKSSSRPTTVHEKLKSDFLGKFLQLDTLQLGTLPHSHGFHITSELYRCALDIVESARVMYSTRQGTAQNEAEVRFSTVDPIVKSIARLTNTVLSAEVSVKSSDTSSYISDTSTSLDATPQQQYTLSRNIIPDYTFYSLTDRGRACVCSFVEVKKREHFNDNSVCQTIGYHIAGRAGATNPATLDGEPATRKPPLAILICENRLRFIFYPFSKDDASCIDAIVTPPIALYGFVGSTIAIDEDWFSFVCFYIGRLWVSGMTTMNPDDYLLKPHFKKEYINLMQPLPTMASLWQKLEEEQKENSELKRLVTELQEQIAKKSTPT